MSLEIPQSPLGVLSNDEELVVSLVREIVGKIRAEGRMVDMVLVEKALAESGMRAEGYSQGMGGKVFVVRNARFFIQGCEAHLGCVELVFADTNT